MVAMHKHRWRAYRAREFTFAKCECGAMMWKPHSGKNGVEIMDVEVSAGIAPESA